MKKVVVALLGFLLLVSFASAQTKKKVTKGKLDKKAYVCTFLQGGGKDAFQDELKFTAGTFLCGIMTEDGFKAAAYDCIVDSSGDTPTITFTCEIKNAKEDVYSWSGTITGDDITGNASLANKKGKIKKTYTFNGTLKGKKQPSEY
jgi:hypothetical protein